MSGRSQGLAARAAARLGLRGGFTLVELLVVITIIAILVALAMPGIQASRETARKVECANNLHQLGLAVQCHIARNGIYPTGGWGYDWVGDPDRGYRRRQPGGWVYNLLPFIDSQPWHDLGVGETQAAKKKAAATQLIQIPLPIMNCSSRRRAVLYPIPHGPVNSDQYQNATMAAKGDYAISAGSVAIGTAKGPPDLASGDQPGFLWLDNRVYTGISFQRSEVTAADVRDGEGCTLLIGEKFLDSDHYLDYTGNANNETLYTGFDLDNYRCTSSPSQPKGAPPRRDQAGIDELESAAGTFNYGYLFGSAHPASCNFVFCDGSVRPISYGVDPLVFCSLGHRADGLPTDMSGF